MPAISTISAYLAMGGYAAFVWPAYGLTAAVLGGLALHSWRRYQHSLRALEGLQQQLRTTTMTRKQQRLCVLALGMTALAAATALVLSAFSEQSRVFLQPERSEDAGDLNRPPDADRRPRRTPERLARVGGRTVSFRITDGKNDIAVIYRGILPDLFREGQGVVAEGRLEPDGVFAASTVLAKHDERYMPREVVDALKKSGHWQEGAAAAAAAAPLKAAATARPLG